jgi:hypothetical protein
MDRLRHPIYVMISTIHLLGLGDASRRPVVRLEADAGPAWWSRET